MIDGVNPAFADRRAIIVALALALGLLMFPTVAAHAGELNLTETGSSLLYPLFNVWVSEYTKTHPGVHLTTASTGSGAGIEQAISGAVQIGASDAYMSDAQARQNPQIVNVPMAISALTVNYNLPEFNATQHLKLDGPTLAGIYTGKIRAWDDKSIAALNPDLKLPHHDIIPIHRADGSGDTFVFTQYLTFSTPTWEDKEGYGTTITWPEVPGGLSADGNLGVLKASQQTPYSITYLGVSFHNEIAEANLGTALLKSYSGEFLLPTPDTIASAAASLPPGRRRTSA
jgi:phosphate transport system substrate-binding protein